MQGSSTRSRSTLAMAIKPLHRSTFHCLVSTRDHPAFPSRLISFRSLSTSSKPNLTIPPRFSDESLYRKQISLASLLKRYGFPPTHLQDFISKNRFLLAHDLVAIEKSLGILLSLKLSQKVIVSMICECPAVLEYEFLKKWEGGISENVTFKAPPSMVQSILECSRRFQLNPDHLSKSLRVLRGFGLSDGTICKVLEDFPGVMMMEEAELQSRIKFFIKIGIPRNAIDQVFFLFPGILKLGVEHRLKPLMEEFGELGFSENLLRKEILREPRIVGMELGELSLCLDFLKSLKCREPIREKILNKGAFRAGLEVKLRVDCLCRHGLIRSEAFKVLWKEPRAILYEIDEIDQKIEFLVHRMKLGVGRLVEVPEYLGVNFKKQIVPRYNVIEYLRLKGGLGCDVCLRNLIKLSRSKFYNLYVKPYPECERMYPISKDVEPKPRHPEGLWKLLRPPKHEDSKEDVENIKSFMESLF